MIGDIVCSNVGHDKGEIYFIFKEETSYVYLVNGKNRCKKNPKKKKKKHVTVIEHIFSSLDTYTDVVIKKTLKDYKRKMITQLG
ncbi:MAG: RNA-binding protein [Lachnospiraceae bacterium]